MKLINFYACAARGHVRPLHGPSSHSVALRATMGRFAAHWALRATFGHMVALRATMGRFAAQWATLGRFAVLRATLGHLVALRATLGRFAALGPSALRAENFLA